MTMTAGHRPRGKRGGSTTRWRKIRALVLDRDGHRCQLQLQPWGPSPEQRCQVTATVAHHVRGWQYGDDPDHVIAACAPCNTRVGDPQRSDPRPVPRTQW